MKVSALTLVHNRADLLPATIASVLEQSYPVHEFIIIDDGSTENIKAVVDQFRDPRIQYFYYKRIGLISRLRNIALSKASGEVIAFIDSDDLWHKDKIRIHLEDMLANQAVISFSDCRQFDTQGWMGESICHGMNKTNVSVFKELTEHNQSLAYGTNLFFQRCLEGTPLQFDERLYSGEHDFIMMLAATQKTTYIDEVLNYIRRNDRNISSASRLGILPLLEYNRTLDKLLKKDLITKQLYKKIRASNYSKVGLDYLNKKRFRMSRRYLCAALCLHPRMSYFKVLLKALAGASSGKTSR